MDLDEFDGDDIADEDFIVAATQATTPTRASSNPNFHNDRSPHRGIRASAPSASFNSSMSRQQRPMVSSPYLCYLPK